VHNTANERTNERTERTASDSALMLTLCALQMLVLLLLLLLLTEPNRTEQNRTETD